MKEQTDLFKEELIDFIQRYAEDNGEPPLNEEWKLKNGFPYSRETLRKKLLAYNYTYNDLLEEAGFKRRMPYNAKDGKLTKENIVNFIQKYYEVNGVVPCLKEWTVKNGFPCNKEYLAKNYKYNDLVENAGLKTYEYGQRHYNITQMLEDIRKVVIESRSFNINVLHEKFVYIKHRDTYTRLFGDFENALLAAGIENKHKILINRFNDYKLEEPIVFLKSKFGENGVFTEEQNTLIETIKIASMDGDLRRVHLAKKISLHKCKKLFETYSIALIAAGLNPAKTMRTRIKAIDGHICDSYEESLIDNILYKLNIPHEVHVKYNGSDLICDFKLEEDIIIEYIGFSKVKNNYIRNQYNKRLADKKKLAKQLHNKLIIIDSVDENTVDLIKSK